MKDVSARRPLTLLGVLASVIAATWAIPQAAAAEPAGATFLDTKPIALTLAVADAAQPIDLTVVNGGAEAVTLTLSLVAVGLPDGARSFPVDPPPKEGVLATKLDVAVGDTWSPVVAINPAKAEPGDYAAQFVVYASDGSVDRRDITIVVAAASPDPNATPTPVRLEGTALTEPLPPITLASERWTWPWNDSEYLGPTSVDLDPSLVPELVPGALVSEDGSLALVMIESEGTLTVIGPAPGAYKGKLGRLPEGTETAPAALADITLSIRDAWLWPLIFLFAGLSTAMLVEWLATDRLPRKDLNARLAELVERAMGPRRSREAWFAEEHRWLGRNRIPLVIDGLDSEGKPLLLNEAIEEAVEDFTGTPSAEKRAEKWGSRGTEFVKIADTVSQYEAILESQMRINDSLEAIEGRLPEQGRDRLLRYLMQSGMRLEVWDALAGARIKSASDFNAIKADIESAEKQVGRAKAIADFLSGMTPDSGMPDNLFSLWVRLVQLGSSDLSDVDQLEKDVKAYRDPSVDSVARTQYALRGYAFAETADLDLFAALFGSNAILAATVVPSLPDIEALVKTPDQIRASLRTWSVLSSVAVLVSVAIVAMSTQYFGKPTFGASGDYIAILAWAFVGTAGAKLLAQLGGAVTSLLGASGK